MEAILNDLYKDISNDELKERIRGRKNQLGKQLLILTHHYQQKEIVELGNYRGDSYELSLRASESDAEYIVFCGVHFMAESAEILSKEDQKVHLPDLQAGCPMAEMAKIEDVETAWVEIGDICGGINKIVPITYINSTADLKAFCGKRGGSVCTSANAQAVISWGFSQKEKIFFFPDEHLGKNIVKRLGKLKEDIILWDPSQDLGGNSPEEIRRAKIILWKGFCHVHTWFQPNHVDKVRKEFPGVKVIVHPECTEDVVDMADGFGSTNFIAKYVKEAPSGSVIAIGTEINLVNRLAKENPDKMIFALSRSLCPNMYKIGLNDLYKTLDKIGEINVIHVPEEVKKYARLSLEMMINITEKGGK